MNPAAIPEWALTGGSAGHYHDIDWPALPAMIVRLCIRRSAATRMTEFKCQSFPGIYLEPRRLLPTCRHLPRHLTNLADAPVVVGLLRPRRQTSGEHEAELGISRVRVARDGAAD